MLRIIIAALLICTVLAGAKLIFQGGEGDISWNVNHIGVLYIRHWVVVPNATPRVEVRGFDQDRVVTAGTLKYGILDNLRLGDARQNLVNIYFPRLLQLVGLSNATKVLLLSKHSVQLFGGGWEEIGYIFWDSDHKTGMRFLAEFIMTRGSKWSQQTVYVVLFARPGWGISPAYNGSIPPHNKSHFAFFDPQTSETFYILSISLTSSFLSKDNYLSLELIEWSGDAYRVVASRTLPVNLPEVYVGRYNITAVIRNGSLDVVVRGIYADEHMTRGYFIHNASFIIRPFPPGRYVFGLGAAGGYGDVALLSAYVESEESRAANLTEDLNNVLRMLARSSFYLVKRGEDHRLSVLSTAASISGVLWQPGAGSLQELLGKISASSETNASLVALDTPLGGRYYVVALRVGNHTVLYDPSGVVVRMFNISALAINEDLYIVGNLPKAMRYWLRWSPRPALGEAEARGRYIRGVVYGVNPSRKIEVIARGNGTTTVIRPEVSAFGGPVVQRLVFTAELPPGTRRFAVYIDGELVYNFTVAEAPAVVAPKIHVFLHNSTLCVDLSDFDMPRGVVDVPGLSWRGGLTWCGRAELPGYIRVRIGELERRYYVAKPEVRLYSLSPGLSPLASVSGALCGVSLDTLDAPGITPYPHTSVLYTDGVIYAYVYPGPVVRQIRLVLRELCAPVFYHLEATTNVTGRQIRAVVLVIDVSGSMAGEKLETAKRVASTVVDILAGGKVPIGLIAFSDRPRVVSPLTTDYTKLKRDLGALSAGGSTNIGDSLTAAFELLGGTGAVVLLTDGQHNVGTPPAQALSRIKITAPVYAIGLGKDVNEAELRYIARQTGGVYLFSPTAKELEQAFSQWLWSWETLVFNGTGSASISGSLGLYRIHAQDPNGVELIFQTSPTFADRCAAIPLTLVDQCGLGHYDPSTKTATINTYGASFTISAKTPATVSSPMPTTQFIVGSDAACVGDHYTFKVVGLSEVAAYIDGRRVSVEEVGGWRRVRIDSGVVLRIEAKILDPVTKAVVKTELKTVDIRKCAEIKVQPPELRGKAPSNFQMTLTVTGAVSPGQLEIFIVPPLEVELDRIRIRPANPNEPYEITGRVLRAVDDYIVVNLLQGGNKLADKLVKVSFETTGSVRPASDSKVIIQPVGTHSDNIDTVATGTPQLKLLYTPEWAKATVEGSTIKLSTELKTPGLYSDSLAFTDMYNIWRIRLVAVAVGNEVDLSTVKWALADKWELSLPYLTLTARRPGYIVTGLVTKFQGLVKPPYIYAVYTNATFEAEPAPGWRLLYYYQGKWTTRRPPSISFQQHTPYIAVAPDVKYDVNLDGKIDLGDLYTVWLRIKGQQLNVGDDILDVNGDGVVDINDITAILINVK